MSLNRVTGSWSRGSWSGFVVPGFVVLGPVQSNLADKQADPPIASVSLDTGDGPHARCGNQAEDEADLVAVLPWFDAAGRHRCADLIRAVHPEHPRLKLSG